MHRLQNKPKTFVVPEGLPKILKEELQALQARANASRLSHRINTLERHYKEKHYRDCKERTLYFQASLNAEDRLSMTLREAVEEGFRIGSAPLLRIIAAEIAKNEIMQRQLEAMASFIRENTRHDRKHKPRVLREN